LIDSEYLIFSSIYESSSLSKAADRLNKQQSQLSKILASLEFQLGDKLFIRTNRGLKPTESGHLLYAQVQKQIQLWEDYRAQGAKMAESPRGLIKFGCHQTIGRQLIKPLSKIYSSYEDLEFRLEFDRSPSVTRKILNHELDLGVIASPQRHNELVIKKLFNESVGLFSYQDNVAPFITYNPELISSNAILKSHQKGAERLIEVQDYDTAANLARSLGGAAIVPESVALKHSLNYLIGSPYFKASISLVYRSDNRPHKDILKAFTEVF
jgi:DNA-binding transcriptional LysR family regulator